MNKLTGLLVVMVVGGFYLATVVLRPPGGEDVIDQQERPLPPPSSTHSLADVLRSKWDSEAYADWPVAEVMARVSHLAYQPPLNAKADFEKLGFQRVETFVDGSMIGYVASHDDVSVVGFHGTDDKSDWIANLDQRTVDTPYGPVHRGFHSAYNKLRPQIVGVLKNEEPNHVWVTGHSLGGALALVCAYDLIESGAASIDGLITFGQPMAVRDSMANHIDRILLGKYAHYVNAFDIVPRIPPTFDHCGSLVWFKSDGSVKRSRPKRASFGANLGAVGDSEELTAMSLEEFRALQEGMQPKNEPVDSANGPLVAGSSPFIRDHAMERYIDRVRSLSAEKMSPH